MARVRFVTATLGLLMAIGTLSAQAPPADQVRQERAQAELDVPQLVEALGLKPGMAVADVGAGFGAMTVVLAKWIGAGHVFATDVAERQLSVIRDYVAAEGLKNATVIAGGAATTNLPRECCEAMFLQLVYHHIREIDGFNKSLYASLKPGGRLAIIDSVPSPGSELPQGVPANRGGHGVPSSVVIDELKAAGFVHVRTIDKWPPGKGPGFLALFEKR
jgi:predicted methyltransferase